jgi:S1-C subfamily serine protease
VVKDGPAYLAGLRQGDVIVGYNGGNVTNPNQLVELIQGTAIGNEVEIKFIRGGQINTTVITIAKKQQ